MEKKLIQIAICLAAFAASAAAQTGTVPLDNGTPPSGLTNSNITVSNGNVGIGTASLDSKQIVPMITGLPNTFPFPATGPVGIGTTSPTYLLTVNGIIGDNGEFILGNAIGQWPLSALSMGYDATVQEGWLQAGSNTTSGPLSLNAQGGKVGIGTASPAGGSLVIGNQDVARNVRIHPYAYFGSGYSTWDTIFGSNARAREGTTNSGYELGSSYTGQGASMFVSNFGNYSALYQWKASDISGYSEGQLLTLPTATIYFDSNRNVGIGTTSPAYSLDVGGKVRTTSAVVYPDGTQQTTAWTGVLCGGDYAEAVDAKGDKKSYEPGDVMVLSEGNGEDVEKSSTPYSTMVAGIYATKPGVIGRRQILPQSGQELPMALIGIVPTKVTTDNGPIRKGDLLVTSSRPGYAMRGTDREKMLGAVIGKAMGSLDSGSGVIEVLVTLQ